MKIIWQRKTWHIPESNFYQALVAGVYYSAVTNKFLSNGDIELLGAVFEDLSKDDSIDLLDQYGSASLPITLIDETGITKFSPASDDSRIQRIEFMLDEKTNFINYCLLKYPDGKSRELDISPSVSTALQWLFERNH